MFNSIAVRSVPSCSTARLVPPYTTATSAWLAVVAAAGKDIGTWPDNGDLINARSIERQDPVVLEQDDRLLGHLGREGTIGIDHARWYLRIGHHGWRIKLAQAKSEPQHARICA